MNRQAIINLTRKSILIDFIENHVRLSSKEQQQLEVTEQAD